jgi:diphthamide synthase (EF-2-diphthine--ammonia ligase)
MEPLGYRGLEEPSARHPGEVLMPRPQAAVSWSGGRTVAAYARARDDYEISAAITMFDEAGSRSRSHGLRPEIVEAQLDRLRLRPIAGRCGWDTYDSAFADALHAAADIGITHVIFGDILFDEHREWAERITAACGLTAVEPLWKRSTADLYREFIASGARARIVTVRASKLDDTYLGRELTASLMAELIERGCRPVR